MSLIEQIEEKQKKNIKEQFRAGDTVKVFFKVVEGGNERIQAFEGVVIQKRGTGLTETFTERKISFGVGVERIFPIHSPRIEKIQVMRQGKVRKSKLYYLRNLSGKAARIADVQRKQQAEEIAVENKAV